MTTSRRRLRAHLAAFASYVVVATIVTFPLVTRFSTHFPGGPNDTDVFGFLWNNWWVYHAIVHLHAKPYLTTYIFAPYPIDLRLHTFGLLYGLLSIPLMPLLGPVGVLNAQVVLTIALNGYSSCRLTQYLSGHLGVGFLAGLLVASTPAIDFHLGVGRPSCAALWPAICALYFGLRLLETPAVPVAAALAVSLVATLMADQQIALFCTFWLVLLAGHAVLTRRREVMDRRFLILAAGAAVLPSIAAYLLYYVPLARDVGYTVPGALEAINYSIPPYIFADPAFMWGIYGIALPLALLSLLRTARWPELWPWALGSLGFVVLTMGPVLAGTDVPLPFALIRKLPGLSQFRTPYRFQIPAVLGMAVTVGLALSRVAKSLDARSARRFLLLVGVLIVGDTIAHRLVRGFSIQTMASEPFYADIAQDPRDCLVLEVPFGIRTGTDRIGSGEVLSFYQPTHGKRAINGFVARAPIAALSYYRGSPALMTLANETAPPGDIDADLTMRMKELHVGFVVVHPQMVGPDRLPQVLEFLGRAGDLRRVPSSGDLVVFRRSSPES
jgi:hypothetical protein